MGTIDKIVNALVIAIIAGMAIGVGSVVVSIVDYAHAGILKNLSMAIILPAAIAMWFTLIYEMSSKHYSKHY